MRRQLLAALSIGTAGLLALTACGSDDAATGSTTTAATPKKVGVILPDSASSARWETSDRVFLTAAFKAAGIESDIQNAGGDRGKFQTLADGMISAGVGALLITNLDSESGAAVIKKAADAGIPVIDYDRLSVGGGADYYVSFDNVAVGTAIGEGLVKCLQDDGKTSGAVIELDGAPTDNNATLFKQGYNAAITAAGYTVVAEQAVPDWDNTQAGVLFEQLNTANAGKYIGVAAANDGLGGAVIARLKAEGLEGEIPVTGQDATDEGLQRVLLGTQCVTVYKAVKAQAEAASDLAIKLINGDRPGADAAAAQTTLDETTKKEVKSVLLKPQQIFAENVKDVIADGFTTADKICSSPELKEKCTEFGVS